MHNNLVYPLLRRFTAKGWVTKKTVPGLRGQTREQYALTTLGRTELIRRLSEFSDAEASSQQGFVTRVGMFNVLESQVRTRILEQRESYLRSRKEKLSSMQENLNLEMYGGEVVRYLIEQIHTELVWVRRLHRLAARTKDHRRGVEGRKV